MNKALLSLLFSLTVLVASSQRIYYIYLQTETQQPFFVKLDEKIHSSTASGYLILSRLRDSTYHFTIGFPGNTIGEQKFVCSINKNDHGYLIKNFGEKGWGLVDIQTASLQMATSDAKKETSGINMPVNAFTDLLAKAADDSTLKQKNVLAEEEKTNSVAKVAQKKEITGAAGGDKTTTIITKDTLAKKDMNTSLTNVAGQQKQKQKQNSKIQASNVAMDKAVPPPSLSDTSLDKSFAATKKIDTAKTNSNIIPVSVVIKKKEDNKETGMVKPGGKTVPNNPIRLETLPKIDSTTKTTTALTDTPHEKSIEVQAPPDPVSNSTEVFVRSKVIRKSESSTTLGLGLVYLDTYADGKQDTIRLMIPPENKMQFADLVTKDTAARKTESTVAPVETATKDNVVAVKKNVSQHCKDVASDDDFYSLRKKMASGRSDVDMINEAKKSFRSKCFTTVQIKNLGSLFLGDGGKYNFFDAAYQHIADTENFPALQSELKDEYFVGRFKAILQ